MTKPTDKKCGCCDEDFESKLEQKFARWGKHWNSCGKPHSGGGCGGGLYCVAAIGAAVYFVQQVSGFGPTLLALLKAMVWPAFLVYEAFSRLGI